MIKNAKFISSAEDLRDAPRLAKSEVAFLGRSNVGKSSLINALCHAKIAKSSATPGKTRLINFFDVEFSANLAAKCENNGEISANLVERENVAGAANSSEIQANLNRDISPTAKHNKNSSINLAQTPPPNPLPQGEGALHAQISAQNSSLNSVQTMDCRGSLREPRTQRVAEQNYAGAANSSEIQANLSEKFRLVFVDLPGFGYAKVGKKMREAWDKKLDEFLRKRVEIRLFVHLRDARHFELNFDEEISAYLKSLAKPDQMVLCVFTKADKLNQSQRARLKAKFPDALLVSSATQQGLKELERVILDLVLGMNLGENLVNLHANLSEIQANLNRDISPCKSKAQYDKNLHAKPENSAILKSNSHKKTLNSTSKVVDCRENFTNAKFSRNDGGVANLNRDVSPCKSKAQYDKNSSINLAQTPPPNPLPQGAGAFDAVNLSSNLKSKIVDCFGDKSPRTQRVAKQNYGGVANLNKISSQKPKNSVNLKSNSHKNSISNLNNKFRTSCDMDCRENFTNAKFSRNDGGVANLNRDVSPCKSKAKHDKNSHQISQISKPKISANLSTNSHEKKLNLTSKVVDCHENFTNAKFSRNDGIKNSRQISQISKPKNPTNSNKISRQKSPNSTKARHDNA